MPRRIALEPDALVVRFDGLTRLLAMRRVLRVPYASIRRVWDGPFDPGGSAAWRVAGTCTAPFGSRCEGHFRWRKRWAFLSYTDRRRSVAIDVADPRLRYALVAVEPDDPEALRAELRARAG
jgi:hypothetical protein